MTLPDYIGARYRPARRPKGPPPNLGFPTSIVGGPGITVTLPPDIITDHKAFYLQWTANVAASHPGDPQGWGFTDVYNAALFNSGAQGLQRFQWNDIDNANTYYLIVHHDGSYFIDWAGPVQRTGDKCVIQIPFPGAQVSFSSYRNGVGIVDSFFTFGGGVNLDTVNMAGPASNIIALDHIPASIPI